MHYSTLEPRETKSMRSERLMAKRRFMICSLCQFRTRSGLHVLAKNKKVTLYRDIYFWWARKYSTSYERLTVWVEHLFPTECPRQFMNQSTAGRLSRTPPKLWHPSGDIQERDASKYYSLAFSLLSNLWIPLPLSYMWWVQNGLELSSHKKLEESISPSFFSFMECLSRQQDTASASQRSQFLTPTTLI